MTPQRYAVLITGLLALLLLLALAALGLGAVPLTPARALAGLWGSGDREAVLILREVRLPRLLLGLAIGAGLGATGAALQALLQQRAKGAFISADQLRAKVASQVR